MAYGQTSAGKTYTLLGGETKDRKGILPRFVEDLFNESEKMGKGQLQVKCSFFEIYNENLYDLLDENQSKFAFLFNFG